MNPRHYASAFLLTTTLFACNAAQHAERADEVVDMPEDYGDAQVEGIEIDAWCSDFGQPGLERLVERAWAENLELRAGWARLEEAEALVDIARAPLWPWFSTEAGVGRSKRYLGDIESGIPGDVATSETETEWNLSAAASYEVDIWGRNRSRARAAEFDARAVEASVRSLAITLTSEVAEAWFDVVAQRERVALLEEQFEVSRDLLELTRGRYESGRATSLDLTQQEQNLEALRGQLAQALAQLETSRNRLAVLLGESPTEEIEVAAEELPELPPMPDPGVPADVLERRPDVRSAHLQLEAADERTAAAVAERLPTLRLSASVFFRARDLTNLLEQLFWSVAADLAQPLFEGGQLRAEVRRAESVAEQRLFEYAQTLLTALQEVRDALVLEQRQAELIESLESQLESAESAHELARTRYLRGGLDYLRALTALQSLQQVEQNLLEARRQQISNRISLCRALGGTWVEGVER